MATIRIDLQSSGNARQELQQVQQQVVTLNEQIARNNRLAVDATGNARESLREQNQRLRAERGLLTAQRQRLNLLLPGLRDEIRATREATQVTRRFSGVLNEIGGVVGGIGIAELAFHIQQFAANSVRAAAELQGFQRGLQIIEGTNAPNRLQELIEVANLPGLQLAQLINYNNRLRAIGLSAEEVDSILLTTGQTILAMGGTSDIASQAVEQLVQALQTNTVSLQDFRSIAQRIPGFYQAIAATHDVEASIDGFRVAVDNAGGSVKDALLPVMDELARRFGSPPADSYVVAIDGLQNSFFLLQAEIGNNLLPILAQAATGLSQFFDAIRENNLGELPAPIQAIVSGAQSLYNGLIQVGEAIRRGLGPELDLLLPALGTLLGNVLDLAGSLVSALSPAFELLAVPTRVAISLIAHLAETLSTVIGGITDFVNWVTGAAESQEQLRTSTQQTAQVMMTTATATQQAADSTENLQDTLQQLQSDLSSVNERLAEKRRRYEELVSSGANPAHASLQQLDRQITGLEADSARLNGEISRLTTSTQGSTTATDQNTTATSENITSKQEAVVVVMSLSEVYKTLQGNIQTASDLQNTLSERQQDLSAFLRTTSGETENFQQNLQTLIPTITDAEAEQEALNTAVDESGDLLTDIVDSLGLTSDAADTATQSITRLGERVSETGGDIDTASQRLHDFDDAFQLSEATIPRVTSAMREFTGTTPDVDRVTEAVERSTRSVGDLLDEIEAVGDGTRAVGAIEASFQSLADDTVPRVTRDIVDAFVNIAEGDDIPDAFGRLGERAGYTLIDELSSVLSDQLSTAVIGNLQGISLSGIGSTLTGAAAALAAPVGIFAASVAAFALIGEGLVRAFPGEAQEQPITAADVIRAGGRVGAEELGLGITLPQLEQLDFSGLGLLEAFGVDPAGETTGVTRQRPGLGWRYNATLGIWEPRPEIYDENTGSALGAPLATQTQAATGSRQPTERISSSDAASSGERGIGDEIDPLVSRAQDRLINSIIRPVFRGVLSAISDHEIDLDLSDLREELDSNADRISSRLTTNIVRPVIRAMLQEIGDTRNAVDLPSDFEDGIGDSIEDITTRIRTSILNPILRSILASIRAQRDNIALPSEVTENISESVDDISNRIFQNVLSPVLREIQSAVRGVRDDVVLSPEIIGDIQDIPNQIAGVIIREIITPIVRQISSEIRRTDVPAVSSLDFSGITADGSPQTSSITASQTVVRQAMATATEPTGALADTALSTQQIVGDPEREAREAERQREREQREAERAERERTRLIEREQRERQRIAERQQREAERANEQRIREEMRTQDRIDDLRDDAFDNEERRQQRLVDLEQDTQNRILDIQRNANRSREDIERDFQDAYQDIQRQRVFGEITDEEASSRLQELGRERLRDLRDIDIRTRRRREDVGIRQERSEAEIEASAMATANAIREVLTPLLTEQAMPSTEMAMGDPATSPAEASAMAAENTGTTAENTTEISEKLDPVTEIRDYNLEMLQVLGLSLATQTRSAFNLEALLNVTFHGEAARQRLIDEVEALGGMLPDTTQIGLATTETTAAAIQSGIATLEESLGRDIDVMAGAPVESRMMMAGEPLSPQTMQAMNVSISAQNVTVSGGNVGGEVNARITNPEDVGNDVTVELDGEKVGQSVGNKIVQQGQNRRNPLGQNALRR